MKDWIPSALLFVAVVAAACSIQTIFPYGTGTPPGTASALVGPAGGTVTANDGTSIEIPPNALSTSVTITIGLAPDAGPLQGATALAVPHVFGPEGTTFAVPACITMTFEPGLLPAGGTEQNVVLYQLALPEEADGGEAGTAGDAGDAGEPDAAAAATGYQPLPTYAVDTATVTGMTKELSTAVVGFGSAVELPNDAGEAGCGDATPDAVE